MPRNTIRGPGGRFAAGPRPRGIRTRRSIDPKRGVFTRIKVLGAEISYRESGGAMGGGSWGDLSQALKDVNRRANKLTVPFASFKQVWFDQNERIFDAEGIPSWAPLSPSYAKWKATLGDLPILQLSGRLGRSLTQDTEDTVFTPRPRSLQMGTTVEYSPLLQGEPGEPMATGNTPSRPHDVLLPETFAILMEIVGSYVELPLEERA